MRLSDLEQGGFFARPGDWPDLSVYPVDQWNPPFCGRMDMLIRANGDWVYQGTPIHRAAMVRLFSRLLKKEDGAYFLVTPVEKVGIEVEDVPFLAVEWFCEDSTICVRTNCDEVVPLDDDHPLRLNLDNGFKPYIMVRNGLEALFSRSLAHALAEKCMTRPIDGKDWFGLELNARFYSLLESEPTDEEP